MGNIINFIKNTRGFITSTPVTTELIRASQETLKVKFSEEYKEILLNFGALMYHGNEILGLNPDHLADCVNFTMDMKELDDSIPSSMYVIMMSNIDGLIYLQDEMGRVYEHFPFEKCKQISNNLEDFLMTL